MEITKVHYDGTKVQIGVQHGVGKSSLTATIEGKDPTPEFEAALEALRPFVPKLCKPVIVAKQFEEKATVTGISISRKGDDPGYTITAKCPVDGVNSPLNIATPFLLRMPEATGEFQYREALFAALDLVEEEAMKWLRGQRSDLDLFASENGRRPKPEPTPIEAEARLHAAREAFVAALPKRPKGEQFGEDDNLALYISEQWENRATEFEGSEYAGLVRIGETWCYLLSGPEPAFYYDVAAPTEFNAPDAEPDVAGEELIAWAREAWGIPSLAPATAE